MTPQPDTLDSIQILGVSGTLGFVLLLAAATGCAIWWLYLKIERNRNRAYQHYHELDRRLALMEQKDAARDDTLVEVKADLREIKSQHNQVLTQLGEVTGAIRALTAVLNPEGKR